jgi:hypothetical protein
MKTSGTDVRAGDPHIDPSRMQPTENQQAAARMDLLMVERIFALLSHSIIRQFESS